MKEKCNPYWRVILNASSIFQIDQQQTKRNGKDIFTELITMSDA